MHRLSPTGIRLHQVFATGGMGSNLHFAWQQSAGPNVRYGSKADIAAPPTNVRFTPKSGHSLKALEKALGAPLFTRLVDDGSWRACPLSNAAFKVCSVPLQLIECEPNRK